MDAETLRPNAARATPALSLVPPPAVDDRPLARRLTDWREPYLLPLLALLVTRVACWLRLPWASEDAYITFRYARNLALGHGLVFNAGEHVMGFTSPLWTVWSALGVRVIGDPVAWSRVTSVTCDVVTLLVAATLLRRHASRASAWCFAAFFSLWTYFAAVAVSGMESSAMVALLVGAAALVERRSRFAGVLLGALALMRPEGVVAAALLAVPARARDRWVAAAIAVCGFAALWAVFGTIVPQSVTAKSGVYGTPGPFAGRHWWEWLSPFPFGRWPVTSEGSMLFAMACVAGPAAVVGAMALARQWRTALAGACAAGVAIWLGYAALGVAYFSWYLAVPLASLMLLAAVGLPRIARGPAIYAGLLLFTLGTWTIAPGLYQARAYAEATAFGGLADYLAAHGRPDETVLLEPIGIVGWRCRMRVIDQVGLVSPAVSRRRLAGPGWLADVVQRERPAWLVLRRGELTTGVAFAGRGQPFRSPAERSAVLAAYAPATVVAAEAGDAAMVVLHRAPAR